MISYYRNQIYQLKALRSRFESLEDNLNGSVISGLNESYKALDEASTFLVNAYSVDSETADNNSIHNNSIKINEISLKITNDVIPAIQIEIRKINDKISYFSDLLEQELEKEEG